MANLNAPAGLAPVMYRNGNFWNGQARLYAIAAADTFPCYVGDIVKVTGVADANGLQIVTPNRTAGTSARGVVVALALALPYGYQGGPMINPNDLTKVFRPTGAQTSLYYALVVDDPDVVYEIQEGFTATPMTTAQIAKNCNVLYAAPTGPVPVSATVIDPTTYATTATLDLKIIQSIQRADNTPFTTYQRMMVTINNHDFSSGVAGV
jgi:hypothetical protein